MLGNLIKYDLKYGMRVFVLLQCVQLIAAVIGRYFFFERLDFHASPERLISSLYPLFLFIMLIFSIVSFGTMLLIAARFYTNLFTDEGYLTWTIPVSPIQQLWGKLLSGSIWYALGILFTGLSFVILLSGKNTCAAYLEIAPEVTEALGMSLARFSCMMFVESLLTTFSSVLMIYFCIVIGQLLPSHRLLGAVIAYFALYFSIMAVINGSMLASGLFPAISSTYVGDTIAVYVFCAVKITLLVYLITGIAEYFLIRWILTKKLNLN